MKQFFDKEGLTSTSANYVANLAKEMYQNIMSELENLKLYSTTMQLIGSDSETVISKATEEKIFNAIPQKLKELSEAKSLIAWLREAIKEKDEAFDKLNCMSLTDYCEKFNIEYPEHPANIKELTEEEYYNTLSVKDSNRYYSLETECAVIGQFIHNKGAFNKARKELGEICQSPIVVKGEGRDAIVYTRHCSYYIEEVDNMFFQLQKRHRELQAELNGMKHNCQKAIDTFRTKESSRYESELSEYNIKIQSLFLQFNKYKDDRRKEIESWKIIIPNALKDIYDKINNLGK